MDLRRSTLTGFARLHVALSVAAPSVLIDWCVACVRGATCAAVHALAGVPQAYVDPTTAVPSVRVRQALPPKMRVPRVGVLWRTPRLAASRAAVQRADTAHDTRVSVYIFRVRFCAYNL